MPDAWLGKASSRPRVSTASKSPSAPLSDGFFILDAVRNSNHDVLNLFLNKDRSLAFTRSLEASEHGASAMHLATCDKIALSLLQAAREGAMFSNGSDPASKLVNSLDAKGRTPLMMSCKAANYPLTKLLLRNGADPLPSDDKRMNVLHYAAEGGNAGITLLLIKSVGLWGKKGPQASQPKASTVSRRSQGVISSEAAARFVNAADLMGRTPLHYSVFYGSLEATRALIGALID